MDICTIIGARPQFIKAAVVSRAFREHHPDVREVLIHTGQHYDANMSEVFFDELDIQHPDYNLGIGGGTHGQNTGRMIEQIETVLLEEQPDWVLVYGDTDSTLAGALSAVKLHIPVAHVESGLRSFNRRMPEEINRVLTDHAADLLFTPTYTATRNLSDEGISGDRVRQVGDVMYDAAIYYSDIAEGRSQVLNTLCLERKRYILATIHRAENTDSPQKLRNIVDGLAMSPFPVIWPLHPRTCQRLADFALALPPIIRLIDPVGYLDMVMLEKNAALIATDSGGVQKEAYFHNVQCLTLRDETEWMELVEMGANRLIGVSSSEIGQALSAVNERMIERKEIYGTGYASQLVCHDLVDFHLNRIGGT